MRGPSLALGYIGNREATEKAFAPNPLNSLYGERVYRTGDSAMLTDEGDLVFCGRKDNQIKYRGTESNWKRSTRRSKGSPTSTGADAPSIPKRTGYARLRRNGLRERASRSGGIIASRFHEADAHREGAEHAAEQEREGGPCDAPGIARRTGEAREADR